MKIIRVGRSETNDVVINDPSVTRVNHCQIIQDNYGRFKIIDSSTNGTFVNGIRIGRGCEIQLNDMDVVRIGNTILPWRSYFKDGERAYGGEYHNSNDVYVPNGGYSNPIQPQSKPDNYLVWSILSIICCCLPFGIVATVYASKVDGLWNRGNYQEAIDAANSAKTWFWWSFGIGLAINLLGGIYYFLILGLVFI